MLLLIATFSLNIPSRGKIKLDKPFNYLNDIANTLINWIEYLLAIRGDSKLVLLDEKVNEVNTIL